MELPETTQAQRREMNMTTDEKLAIAWIALDGLLMRNFFTEKQYESAKYNEALKNAFEPYRQYIMAKESKETDFLMLLHIQNSVELDLKNGDKRFVGLKPKELSAEVVHGATSQVFLGKEFTVFTAYRNQES
jgi:hypothetical protein